jgi:hypothetical protein
MDYSLRSGYNFRRIWDGENRKIFVDLFMNTPDVSFEKINILIKLPKNKNI